jgi:hypothetical protein
MGHYLGYVIEQLTHTDEREREYWRHCRSAGTRKRLFHPFSFVIEFEGLYWTMHSGPCV